MLQFDPPSRIVALVRLLEYLNGAARVVQIGRIDDEAGHGAKEPSEESLSDRPFTIQRLLMTPRVVEPDERCGKIHEGDPSLARNLHCCARTESQGLRPGCRNVPTATDLGHGTGARVLMVRKIQGNRLEIGQLQNV